MSSSKWFAVVLVAGILLVFVSSAAAIVGIPDETQSSAISAAGFIMITPAGTGPSLADQGLTISVTILDAAAIPIPNYPFQDIWWGRDGAGTLSSCPGGCSADANTDANGETSISGVACAGGWALGGLRVFVAGTPIIGTPTLAIDVNSPDLNGNLIVDIADLGDFAID